MPAQLLQIANLITDVLVLFFVGYYFFRFRAKEAEFDKKSGQTDTEYHKIVDDAQAKERKILEDAAAEADQILAGARRLNQSVKDEVNQALQAMVTDIQKEAFDTAKNFTTEYQLSLKQAATQSMTDFKNIVSGLEADLKKQVNEFHDTLLPNLEKELADYKQFRLDHVETMINQIIAKAAPEILNKSISLEDHRDQVIESLAKAKKAGMFD